MGHEHADINLITLLIGANEPGLEVKDKSGEWIPVNLHMMKLFVILEI